MIVCALLAVFIGVVWSGPAFDGARERVKERRCFPVAKARFVLPAPQPPKCGLCGAVTCAVSSIAQR